MTHCLHGGNLGGSHNGFTALEKIIGTSKSTETDADYVAEHRALKYLRNKIAHYLHDYRASMRHRKKELFEYGKCDESARPGPGSKLYYINSWAMCWPSDHAKKLLTG